MEEIVTYYIRNGSHATVIYAKSIDKDICGCHFSPTQADVNSGWSVSPRNHADSHLFSSLLGIVRVSSHPFHDFIISASLQARGPHDDAYSTRSSALVYAQQTCLSKSSTSSVVTQPKARSILLLLDAHGARSTCTLLTDPVAPRRTFCLPKHTLTCTWARKVQDGYLHVFRLLACSLCHFSQRVRPAWKVPGSMCPACTLPAGHRRLRGKAMWRACICVRRELMGESYKQCLDDNRVKSLLQRMLRIDTYESITGCPRASSTRTSWRLYGVLR
jgi:hypothetical protein